MQEMVVRMLKVDGPLEIFWLMLQFTREPPCVSCLIISVLGSTLARRMPGPGGSSDDEKKPFMEPKSTVLPPGPAP